MKLHEVFGTDRMPELCIDQPVEPDLYMVDAKSAEANGELAEADGEPMPVIKPLDAAGQWKRAKRIAKAQATLADVKTSNAVKLRKAQRRVNDAT